MYITSVILNVILFIYFRKCLSGGVLWEKINILFYIISYIIYDVTPSKYSGTALFTEHPTQQASLLLTQRS